MLVIHYSMHLLPVTPFSLQVGQRRIIIKPLCPSHSLSQYLLAFTTPLHPVVRRIQTQTVSLITDRVSAYIQPLPFPKSAIEQDTPGPLECMRKQRVFRRALPTQLLVQDRPRLSLPVQPVIVRRVDHLLQPLVDLDVARFDAPSADNELVPQRARGCFRARLLIQILDQRRQ